MDIATFGALLRFAMELEEEHLTTYQEAAKKTNKAKSKETFLELAQQNKKNQTQIEKLYLQNIRSDMDIGVQEPIPGLNRSDYLQENESPSGANDTDFLKLATNLEERAQKFYLDSVLQLKTRWPAVARSIDKLAREKIERKAKLESLGN